MRPVDRRRAARGISGIQYDGRCGGESRMASAGRIPAGDPKSPWGLFLLCASEPVLGPITVPGDEIQAGEVIGFMGDSGYGEEGTAGKFPVHLHLGIYIRTGNREEVSVNPYRVLRFTEKTRRRVDLSCVNLLYLILYGFCEESAYGNTVLAPDYKFLRTGGTGIDYQNLNI